MKRTSLNVEVDTAVSQADTSGRDRLLQNTMVSWASYLVLMVSGFIMPRLVDEMIGQTALGIWDLCWTLVNYLAIIGFGIPSSVNRFVALYRENRGSGKLSQLIHSVMFLQTVLAVVIACGVIAVAVVVPDSLSADFDEHKDELSWIVILLGSSLVVQTMFNSSRGILTGHHRWDIHNLLHAGTSLLALITMACVLFLGYGLIGMAAAYLVAVTIFEGFRFYIARRFYSVGSFSLKNVSGAQILELLSFGAKSMAIVLPRTVLRQTINVFVAGHLGPASLAVFSRPMSLTMHVEALLVKFTMMITPTTGSLFGRGDSEGLKDYFIHTTKISILFAGLMLTTLAIIGDWVVGFWMGDDYEDTALIVILAAGFFLPVAHDASARLLMGMNRHGAVAIPLSITLVVSAALMYLFVLRENPSLTSAALTLVVPLTFGYGLLIPIVTCRELEVSAATFGARAIGVPLLTLVPFVVFMYAARQFVLSENFGLASLLVFLAAGWTLFSIEYFVLPGGIREIMRVIAPNSKGARRSLRALKNYIKRVSTTTMLASGVLRAARAVDRHRVTVLTLHSIKGTQEGDLWSPLRPAVDPDVLESTILTLKEHYQFVPVSDVPKILRGDLPPVPNAIAVTIDDGLANAIECGSPVFTRYGIVPMIFVVTGSINNRTPFWFDRVDYAIQTLPQTKRTVTIMGQGVELDLRTRDLARASYTHLRNLAKQEFDSDSDMLQFWDELAHQFENESGRSLQDIFESDGWSRVATWAELESAIRDGKVEVGSHTVNHRRLDRTSESTVRRELVESKKEIESRLGIDCSIFCYPNGDFDDTAKRLVHEAGYELGLTSHAGIASVRDDPFEIRRLSWPEELHGPSLLFRLSTINPRTK